MNNFVEKLLLIKGGPAAFLALLSIFIRKKTCSLKNMTGNRKTEIDRDKIHSAFTAVTLTFAR